MILLTRRSFNLLILLHSINQSVIVAFSTSSLSASDEILANNLVSSARSSGDGVSRKLIYPTSRNYVYLNYKETYGIRYDPGANGDEHRLSLPQMEAPNESNGEGESGSEATPFSPDPSENPEVPVAPDMPETTTECNTEAMPTGTIDDSSASTSNKRPTIAFPSLNHKTSKNNKTQIVQPISSIRETLNLIKRRIKQWFTSGIDLNAPIINGQRFLNVFNIIRFENSECTSTQEMLEEMVGTCYHDYQCTEMGGTSIGECADGLGVCCICMSIF